MLSRRGFIGTLATAMSGWMARAPASVIPMILDPPGGVVRRVEASALAEAYGIAGDGTTDDAPAILSLITAELPGGGELVLSAPHGIGSDLLIPWNVRLCFVPGGQLRRTVPLGVQPTLTLSTVDAGAWQIFDSGSLGTVRWRRGQVPTIRPEWFGARANGDTDCYPAFRAMIKTVNESGSGRIEFSRGTYRIDRFRIRGGTDANGVGVFEFKDVHGLQLVGNGTRIDHKGDFHRSADSRQRRAGTSGAFSYRTSVSWSFRRCSMVEITGIEFDGNADRMTRAAGVLEDAFGSGLRFLSCARVTLRDVLVHHWFTDGLNFSRDGNSRGSVAPCTEVLCSAVRSLNNGRQAITIAHLHGGRFVDCRFNGSGDTGGAYGGHAPMAGVDVEPIGTAEGGLVSRNTGNLAFLRCEISNNRGYIVTARYPEMYSGRISFTACTMDVGQATPESRTRIKFLLQAPEAVVEDSSLNLRNGVARLTWRGGGSLRSTYRSVEFRAARPGLAIVSSESSSLELDRCRFILETESPAQGPLVRITNSRAILRANRFSISSGASGRGTNRPLVVLDVAQAAGNAFETDRRSGPPILVWQRASTGAATAKVTGNIRVTGS